MQTTLEANARTHKIAMAGTIHGTAPVAAKICSSTSHGRSRKIFSLHSSRMVKESDLYEI